MAEFGSADSGASLGEILGAALKKKQSEAGQDDSVEGEKAEEKAKE